MTLAEVKAGCVSLVRAQFPGIKIYSHSVVEGFVRPAFFMQLRPTLMEPVNYNTRRTLATLYINYFQAEVDEGDALDVIGRMRDSFGLGVRIGSRVAGVSGFSYDFIGSERNIPEASVDLEWFDRISHAEAAPLAGEAVIKQILRQEG